MKSYITNLKAIVVLLIGLFFITGDLNAQIQYEIGKKTMTLTDASRSNRKVNVVIFYPADNGGTNVAMALPANKKFPLIVFGHGFITPIHYYRYIKDFYVPRGFMVAYPRTEFGFFPDHEEFAKDMAFIIDEMEKMKLDPNSFFYGRYNNKSCVAGHSMGGGAAFLAAEMKPNITTMFTIAAAETNPSAIAAAQNITIPALVFSGGKDCVVPASGNQEDMFNNLASSCKVFVNQLEATHCQFSMDNFFCTLGESGCTPSNISADTTNLYSNMLSVSFLRYYMKYNALAWPLFISKMDSLPGVVYVNNCFVPTPPRIAEDGSDTEGLLSKFNVYPNPANVNENISIDVISTETSEVNLNIINTLGQQVVGRKVTVQEGVNTLSIDTQALPAGNYIITVTDKLYQRISKPLLIQ